MYLFCKIDAHINMLELTRIPPEWYEIIYKKLHESFRSTILSDIVLFRLYSEIEKSLFEVVRRKHFRPLNSQKY